MNQEFAYGGIVFNKEGKVLMRSPMGHWGGYFWTFAKGGSDKSDKTPEETAIREVKEETGYECNILSIIPGEFESDTCTTKYFLMEPTGVKVEHDKETQEIKWVDEEEAFKMIEQTKTLKGRNRDKQALESAIKLRDLLKVNSGSENVI
ncbi:NUDIX hydrolase [Paenibacillaceae bacterium]|nr:NUDIX hydrolase [Paenibacillaceae bacterium]